MQTTTNVAQGATVSKLAFLDPVVADIKELYALRGARHAVLAAAVAVGGGANFLSNSSIAPGSQTLGSDITTGGAAISGGDYSPQTAAKAFDNTVAYWASSQSSSHSGVSYIGYGLASGQSKYVGQVTLTYEVALASQCLTSWKVQSSPDSTTWTDVFTWNGLTAVTTVQSCNLPTVPSARYWRLLANSSTSNVVAVREIEFIENTYPVPGTPRVTLLATATPVFVAISSGPTAESSLTFSADVANAWTLTVNSSSYLYVELGGTTGFSALAPTYASLAPTGPSVDQHWFDTSRYVMWRWTGTVWEQKNRVFVGEAFSDSIGTITSLTSYALCGRYIPGRRTAAASTAYVDNHNLGTDLIEVQLYDSTAVGGALRPVALTTATRTAITYTTGASAVERMAIVRRAF